MKIQLNTFVVRRATSENYAESAALLRGGGIDVVILEMQPSSRQLAFCWLMCRDSRVRATFLAPLRALTSWNIQDNAGDIQNFPSVKVLDVPAELLIGALRKAEVVVTKIKPKTTITRRRK